MSRAGVVARRYGGDALVVLAAAEATVEVAVRRHDADAPRTTLWVEIVAIVVMMAPLLVRRRFPFAAPAAFWLLAAAVSFVDGRLVPFLFSVFVAGMAAAFLLGNVRDAVQARLGLAIVLGAALIVVYDKPEDGAGQYVFIPLLFCLCWLGGFAVRLRGQQAEAAESRAAQAERERDLAARIAVAEERARIARELHDIVAHAVSVMVLQVGAVRHKLPADRRDDAEALQAVEQAGRTALTEMRRLLGAMRADGDAAELAPQPGLDHIEALVEEVGRAGLPVNLTVAGEPVTLERAIDLSAYRIVQEGLTNSLKHAHATRADVTVEYAADELRIEVRDDGTAGAQHANGAGHGLIGIRERVKIYGGDMTAGPASGGRGFVLRTTLPLGGGRR